MTTEMKLPSSDAQPNSIANAGVRRIQIGCWVALIAIAATRAWFTRYELDPDSLSYLDIARSVASGHLDAAVHSYWSPGYPVFISFFFWVFRPNGYWEFPLVHFVNVLIFMGTLVSFQLFWREALWWHRKLTGVSNSKIPGVAFWALGYAVFGIGTLNLITVGLIKPDLLVSAFCCLAGWSALRFRQVPSFGCSVLLGAVLALAYYAKAPFFPMGIVFLVCACFQRPVSRRTIFLAGTAVATFLLVCAPFVTALSLAKGYLTFGDSARLNQAFYINDVQHDEHWQGGPPGSGMPVHPTRKLNDFPEIYEFTANNMGTYPPWFDPTYWNAGITPHLDLKRQPVALVLNFVREFEMVMESGAELVCVLIVLALICSHRRRWMVGLFQLWFIWVPGVVALAMYALVHVEPRFLGGWLILLFAGVVCACSLPTDIGTRRAVSCLGVATLVTAGAAVILQAITEATASGYAAFGRSSEDASIAVSLLKGGLNPGDQVAVISQGPGAYWAHLARLHIVAEIPAVSASRPVHPALDFWEAGPELQERSLAILEQTGARAVIAGTPRFVEGSVPTIVQAPWKRIDGTSSYVYFFPANP